MSATNRDAVSNVCNIETITIATDAGPVTIQATVYGAFAVHEGGVTWDTDQNGNEVNHRSYFTVTHVASGMSAETDLGNREAHWLARQYNDNPAIVAYCGQTAREATPPPPDLAAWLQRIYAEAAMTYGWHSEQG